MRNVAIAGVLTAVAISVASDVAAQTNSKLTVVVDGIPRQKGQICLRIYNQERGFPQSTASVVQSGCIKATAATVTAQFSGLKPGRYAVAIFHDENNDKKLNTNFLGIPKEGFGISNNPPIKASAPKFKNSSFSVTQDTTIKIKMRYL